MKYESREDRLANSYRKVEAIYRKGHDVDGIIRETGLDRYDVLDIIQKIFALDMKKNRAG